MTIRRWGALPPPEEIHALRTKYGCRIIRECDQGGENMRYIIEEES